MSAEDDDGGGGGSSPPRHRADDDVALLDSGSFAPVRTPNGEVDLLSSEAAAALAGAGSGTPFSITSDDEHDDVPSSNKGGDPDGQGARLDSLRLSTTSSCGDDGSVKSTGSKVGKVGTKITKLSDKTTKIMSDYQAYLAEIETEFPGPDDDGGGHHGDMARAHVHAARDSIRDNYDGNQGGGTMAQLPPVHENGTSPMYATGGGNPGPLARGWDYAVGGGHTNGTIAISRGGADHFDDGITEITDYEGQMMMARGQKYTHPLVQSRRVKKALCLIAATLAVVGISVGLTQSQKDKKLNDLEGEMKSAGDEVEVSSEAAGDSGDNSGGGDQNSEMSAGGGPGLGVGGMNPGAMAEFEAFEQDALYEKATERYAPKQFDRTSGWTGETYTEALVFCGSMPGYAVCPMEVVCPAGPDEEPLGGYQDDNGDGFTWVPILDKPNEWVQTGKQDSCVQYTHMHQAPPSWGIDGGNEAATRNVLCCNDPEMAMQDAYEAAGQKYHPRGFDRDSTPNPYLGQTYDAAIDHCEGLEGAEDYTLCPYDALCPFGPDQLPLGGARDGDGDDATSEAWMPIIDSLNRWVHVGQDNTCIDYEEMHPDNPSWGMTGEDDEAITRNVLCCLRDANTEEAGDAMLVHYEEAVRKYHPHMWDRATGWAGKTYEESTEFCEAVDGYELCPYAALCPLGIDHDAIAMVKEEVMEAWAAIVDQPNMWVSISEEGTCVKYSDAYGNRPEWGMTGEGSGRLTPSIVCCATPGSFDPDQSFVVPTHSDGMEGAAVIGPNPLLEHTDQEMALYQTAAVRYQPKWHSRSKGWNGQTYLEALQYCAKSEPDDAYELCPLAAICPLGQDSEPLGGFREEPEGSWVPIVDDANQWVQVSAGEGGACIRYDHESVTATPEWGLTGEDDEGMTRHVACCLVGGASVTQIGAVPDEAPQTQLMDPPPQTQLMDPPPQTQLMDPPSQPQLMIPTLVQHSAEDMALYMTAAEKYNPKLYDRAKGWVGQTYLEALNFCTFSEPNQAYELCPFDAICPLGQDTEPLGGFLEPMGSWVPILDDANQWVQMSAGDGGPCIRYDHESMTATPEWGLTGEDDEELTRNLACCQVQGGAPVTQIGVVSDAAPQTQLTDPPPPAEEQMAQSITPLLPPSKPTVEEAVIEDGAVLIYADMAAKYHPKEYDRDAGWEGHTYLEAVQFCAASEEYYDLCPMEAVCPMGQDSEPLGGFKQQFTGDGAWVPISDQPNEWVQVSDGEGQEIPLPPCLLHSVLHGDRPEWGITGEGSEELTHNVICCRMTGVGDLLPQVIIPEDEIQFVEGGGVEGSGLTHEELEEEEIEMEDEAEGEQPGLMVAATAAMIEDTQDVVPDVAVNEDPVDSVVPETEEMQLIYQQASELYEPRWFDRSRGWAGSSFQDAFDFCADFDNYMPCPYDAICPLGTGSKPLGGFRNEPNGVQWAPLVDAPNAWVQLSDAEDKQCQRYTHIHPGPPKWGETGEGAEEFTQYLACCKWITDEPTFKPTPPPSTPPPTPPPTPEPTDPPTPPPTDPPTPPPTLEPTNDPTPPPTDPPTPAPVTSSPTHSDAYYYEVIAESLEPLWYDRNNGWEGTTYLEALQFCARQNSRVPCPYIGYCPMAANGKPLGDTKGSGVSWAPIIDAPNGWVQVGEEDTCELYTDLFKGPPEWGLSGQNSEDMTRHLMCCLEEPEPEVTQTEDYEDLPPFTQDEQNVLDIFKAQWYGREEGYQGGTYSEAMQFCHTVANMELCPLVAYCPNGPTEEANGRPLFLQLPPFPDEQWAPIAPEEDNEDDIYVLIGQLNQNPVTTCHTYRSFNNGQLPQWGIDGSRPDLKQYVLCCKDPTYVSEGLNNPTVDLTIGSPAIADQILDKEDFDVESAIANNLEPQWLDYDAGWYGGSHDDAEDFCLTLGRQICPYAAYCPHGPGQPISGGHSTDIASEGVQWAPVFGHENHWVMVGKKHGNSATTCFGHEDLEGVPPEWGLDTSRHEIKMHIMCCKI